MDRPIRVSVYRPHDLDAIHIVIYKDYGERLEVLNPVAIKKDNLQWSWVEYDEGDVPNPTFILPRVLDRLSTVGIAQQLVDGFAELGILPDRVKEQETLMELKHAHLEDMRQLVFGMDWVNIQKGSPVEMVGEEDAALRFRVPDEAQDREVPEDE